jgi:hypothetical protein
MCPILLKNRAVFDLELQRLCSILQIFLLALLAQRTIVRGNMRINIFNVSVFAASAVAVVLPLQSALAVADADADAARIARLEQRLLELEQRLADTEQETKEVKVLAASSSAGASNASILGNAATFDILAGSAWRNLRWTQEEQWLDVRPGISEENVIELLGSPPRSVKSLKPRVDKVIYYETSIRDSSNSLRGKISFKDGIVIAVQKPNFKSLKLVN